jgi:hypothetical protein
MGAVRTLILRYRRLALLLAVLAVAMKAVVPGGYMIGSQDRVLTVFICADATGTHLTKQIVLPGSDKTEGQRKASEVCPYASLSFASLHSVALPLLALALAFILLLGFAPVRIPGLAGLPYVRPPLRGPPALT